MTDNPNPPQSSSTKATSPKDGAEWVVRLDSDQAIWTDSKEFQAWYAASEANRRDFSVHKEIWEAVGHLAVNPQARSILVKTKTVPMYRSRRALFGLLAGGAMAAGAAFFLMPKAAAPLEQAYSTIRGERKDLQLADGSDLFLNTDSTVRVRFTDAERHIFLDQGQLFIRVAKDADRPLRVFVKDHEVRAVGTAFDVYRDDEQKTTRVRLAEGIVAIYDVSVGHVAGRNEHPSVVLKPGQQATLAAIGQPGVSDIDERTVEAWLNGRVIFDETPLPEAIRDVNRYRSSRIVLGDESVKTLRISGVFSTSQLEDFPEALAGALPVRVVVTDPSEVVILRR